MVLRTGDVLLDIEELCISLCALIQFGNPVLGVLVRSTGLVVYFEKGTELRVSDPMVNGLGYDRQCLTE